MKKYIIAFGLFFLSLFLIDEVYAVAVPGWGITLEKPSFLAAGNCSSSNCSTQLALASNGNFTAFKDVSGINMSANGTGFMWVVRNDNLFKSGYIYSMAIYMCHDKSTNYVFKNAYTHSSLGDLLSKNTAVTLYKESTWTNLSTDPYNDGVTFNKCGVSSVTFKSNAEGGYYGVNLTVDTTVSGFVSSFVGYKVETLGNANNLTTSQVQNIINNSDLAKASSIEEVQQAQEEIKTELQNTQSAIDNQTQQQQEQHQETMDTITDSDSSGATGDAGSFFDSFTSEDNGGISSIITAPLNLINGMLDVNTQTCQPLLVNILGKDVDLPCGKLLWSRAPDSIVVLWQTIICGFFSYKLIVSLYHDIDKLKDPEQKGVDTLDL